MLVTGAALAWTLWMGGCINHSACACTLDAKAVLSWEDVPESFFDHNFSMFQYSIMLFMFPVKIRNW